MVLLQASAHSHTSTHSYLCGFVAIVPRFQNANIVIVKVGKVIFFTLAASGIEKVVKRGLKDVNCTWG